MKRSATIVVLVLIADQVSKFWVKTNMYLGQEYKIISDWFIIHFTENNGMAFGLEFGGDTGKIMLTLFRLIAVAGIIYYLLKLIREKAQTLLIISLTLILAGALGNIIDSTFYGALFSSSTYELARFLPDDGGYAPILQGKVVDMLYFPIIKTVLPSWVPFWGGDYFEFFRPVFNIADSSIFIGIILLIYVQIFIQTPKDIIEETIEKNSDDTAEAGAVNGGTSAPA